MRWEEETVREWEKGAGRLYRSAAWARCRTAYAKSVGGLCERCLARGLVSPGEEVHHKIKLTPENVDDPRIALNWENLELLCKACHIAEHRRKDRRYRVREDGRLEVVKP